MGDALAVRQDAAERANSASPRSAQRFWQKYFAFYDTLNEAIPYQRMLERAVQLLGLRGDERVLDAGTGTGNVAVLVAARGARVTGVDFCEAGLDFCRAKVPDGDFRFGDLTQPLAFGDASFDGVVCCCVLHLLPRAAQQQALREFVRVVRPGGRVVITVFAKGFRALTVYFETIGERRRAAGVWSALMFGARYSVNTARILYYVRRIKNMEKSGSYDFLDEAQLRSLFETAGLQVERIERTFAGQCLHAAGVKSEAAS